MSYEACACLVVHCDGCGVPLGDDECVWHFSMGDSTDQAVAEAALEYGWTTDGERRWHCERCPELSSPVCRACLVGNHIACEDLDCACAQAAGVPRQDVLPGLAPPGGDGRRTDTLPG